MKTIEKILNVFLLLSFLLFGIFVSCDKSDVNDRFKGIFPEQEIDETFDETDHPEFELINSTGYDYYFCKPWNYDKDYNSNRKYPLVVYLHGNNTSNNTIYPPSYLGYGTSALAEEFMKTYPCFVYFPMTSNLGWNATTLVSQIEEITETYRIDTNRTYIIGYSMGGAGTFTLANGYYNHNGHLFAGIIRLAGYSQSSIDIADAISERTSIWVHCGLDDETNALPTIRTIYDNLKAFHPTASESSYAVVIPDKSYTGTTFVLAKNGIEIAKKTEYDDMGHGISSFPFLGEEPMKWLFNQSLILR